MILLQDKGDGPQYPPFEEGRTYGSTVDDEGHVVPFETIIEGGNGNPDVNVPIEPTTPDKSDDKD
jgi:hypothetical protein